MSTTVSSADDRILARQTRSTRSAPKKKGFHLRKWASNCSTLLADINPSDHGLVYSKELPQ